MILASMILASTTPIAKVSLVPPEPLTLGGYTARGGAKFVPGGDEISVRAFKQERSVIVVAEMLTIPESLLDAVQARVGPNLHVVLIATHTHCAPDSQRLNSRMTFPVPGIATFNRRWLDWTADKIATAVNQAPPMEGRWQMQQARVGLSRPRRQGGVPTQIATRFLLNGQPILDIFAAHPTLFDEKELKLRGDWPGELMKRTNGMAVTGAIGDLSPVPIFPKLDGKSNSMAFARELDTALLKSHRTELGNQPFKIWTQTIELPKVTPHPTFAKEYKVTDQLAESVVGKFAPPIAQLTFINIGEWTLVGVPGEPTSEVARMIRGLRPKTEVISHVNGWCGYILSAPDYGRGGYEATLAFNGPTMAQAVVNAARKGLKNSPN